MNAYKKFGYFYDEVMAQMEYGLWSEFLEDYLKKDDKILDLACGTGTLLSMLYVDGYENLYGLDLSETIIEIANEKRKVNRFQIDFSVQDMTSFKYNTKFNVISCFFDSINFLPTLSQVKKMFDTVYRHLEKDGYFVFDIFSKTMLDEYNNNEIVDDYESFKLKWTTEKVNPTKLKHVISITEDDEEIKEIYYEYYYELKDLLDKRFDIIKISGDFNDELMDEDERILVVLKKK